MKLKISEPDRQPTARGSLPGGPIEAAGAEEPVLLSEQGMHLAPGRTSWQIGQLNLTADRLFFVQPRGVLFDMPLGWLLSVQVERKHYVLVRKPALAVTFQDPRLRGPSTAWFLTPLLGQWLACLTQLVGGDLPAASANWDEEREPERRTHAAPGAGSSGLQFGSLRQGSSHQGSYSQAAAQRPSSPARQQKPERPAADGRVLRPTQAAPHTGDLPSFSPRELARLSKQLDPAGCMILEHLAANSHAPIRELADLVGAATDMEVLFAIRQSINTTAKALLGRPALHFIESQRDQVTGEQVNYAWWLAGSRGRTPQWSETEAEVFDEGERILVVVELAGVSERAIDCEVAEDRLTVRAVDAGRMLRSSTLLPAPVDPEPQSQRFTNGILSIHLRKQQKEG